MSTITFDTLRFAERLRTAGVPEAQAKAEAEALRDVLSEALDMTLATRADILATKTELKTDIVHLDANMIRLDGKITLVQWMLALVIAAEAMPLLAALFK